MSKAIFFDGQKSVDIFNNPEAWTILSGDNDPKGIGKLYQTVSYLYRCVNLRANAVASMPYTILQGKKEIAVWTGQDFEDDLPPKMPWLNNLNELINKTEAAVCLVGGAYWERRKNVLGTRDLRYDWLLPSTVYEIYNGIPGIGGMKRDPDLPTGELLGFWRLEPYYGRRENAAGVARELAIEDMVYFWLPDYGVEIGRAINTPGRAVLQNANVIYAMDAFLYGYFQRGLVKASFLKYKDMITQDEARRVKEWFRRVMLGIQKAFASEVVRGDLEVVTVGEGIRDLRDNALSEEEKISIAVGMGVPVSKLNSTTATDANRNADEVEFIEDTIIPEIGWIFQNLNEQIFNPMGMRIKANPDTLRVMQEDETQRAQAWGTYVNGGMNIELATAILGIDVPDGMELEQPPKPIPPALQPFAGQQNNEQPEEVIEKSAIAVLDLLDKREEKKQFERWLKNRNYTAIKVDEFDSQYLTHADKIDIAIKSLAPHYKATKVDKLQSDYSDQLAAFIEGAIDNDMSQDNFIRGMRDVVYAGLLTVYKKAAGVPDDEKLTTEEMDKFNNILIKELERVDNYARDLYAGLEQKGARFNRVKESLQQLSGNLGGRLSVWANAARMIFNQGMIFGRRDIKMRWGFGATENHCEDCLFYNGQVKDRDEWQSLAGILIYPQSRALACKGYQCDCSLSEI